MSREFIYRLLERAGKTFAQSLLAALTVLGVAADVPIWHLPWGEALGIAATATVLSALTSVASITVGEPGNPSLVPYEGKHRAEDQQ